MGLYNKVYTYLTVYMMVDLKLKLKAEINHFYSNNCLNLKENSWIIETNLQEDVSLLGYFMTLLHPSLNNKKHLIMNILLPSMFSSNSFKYARYLLTYFTTESIYVEGFQFGFVSFRFYSVMLAADCVCFLQVLQEKRATEARQELDRKDREGPLVCF